MSEPIIEVRHLSKSFGTHVVLRDVDFTVKPGDVTCVIGASGSGKSTLLRCINLLETPTAGSILFHGQDIMAKGFDPCGYRARVGMVFQSFNLFNNMTVLENCTAGLRYVLHQDKETAKATALSNLEKVGMSPYIHARPRQLSGWASSSSISSPESTWGSFFTVFSSLIPLAGLESISPRKIKNL